MQRFIFCKVCTILSLTTVQLMPHKAIIYGMKGFHKTLANTIPDKMTKHVRKRICNGTHHSVLDSSPTICKRKYHYVFSPEKRKFHWLPPVELILLQSTFILHFLFCIIRYWNVLYTRDLLIKMKSRKKVVLQLKENIPVMVYLLVDFIFIYAFVIDFCCIP